MRAARSARARNALSRPSAPRAARCRPLPRRSRAHAGPRAWPMLSDSHHALHAAQTHVPGTGRLAVSCKRCPAPAEGVPAAATRQAGVVKGRWLRWRPRRRQGRQPRRHHFRSSGWRGTALLAPARLAGWCLRGLYRPAHATRHGGRAAVGPLQLRVLARWHVVHTPPAARAPGHARTPVAPSRSRRLCQRALAAVGTAWGYDADA